MAERPDTLTVGDRHSLQSTSRIVIRESFTKIEFYILLLLTCRRSGRVATLSPGEFEAHCNVSAHGFTVE